ncbi:hypothetical protein P4V41_08060 [Fictibacillus nanhaiensis]|uniref:hypothetical protein n=1 Tax=Fictibacillus nanhaiensis TaxID=742169 RepID=UPI002E251D88|nr:hypothetical protein [Fictibacillus nanhaiensis]
MSLQAYENYLVYMIQTKLQCEVPESLKHDIVTSLYEYGEFVGSTYKNEKDYWQDKFFRGKGKR